MIIPRRNRIESPNGQIETIYTMPNWLVEDMAFRQDYLKSEFYRLCKAVQEKRPIRNDDITELQHLSCGVIVRLQGDDLPTVSAFDAEIGIPLSKFSMKRILLQNKTEKRWRRELIIAVTRMFQLSMTGSKSLSIIDESQTEIDQTTSEFLNFMENPIEAEATALEIWNEFINDCQVPPSFLVSTRRPLNLRNLKRLRRKYASKYRQVFADKYPWSIRTILERSWGCHHQLDKIDVFPASSKLIVAKGLCCRDNAQCPTAGKLASQLSRFNELGKLDSILDNETFRRMLLFAIDEDKDIISRICENLSLAKRQFELVDEVDHAYSRQQARITISITSDDLNTLLLRMMIRDSYEPNDQFDPAEIVAGLRAVSVDSLSVFVADIRRRTPDVEYTEHSDDDRISVIEEGMSAFLRFIGKSNPPLLTIHQLIKFTGEAIRYSKYAIPETNLNWPVPNEWDLTIQSRLTGVNVKVLTDTPSLIAEGRAMKHCIGDGAYFRSAFLRELAVFSIDASDGRATLTLAPTFSKDGTAIIDWKKDQLKGKENEKASPNCKLAAKSILEYFKDKCPTQLEQNELISKRSLVLHSDDFNRDECEAKNLWNEIYLKLLPRSFSNVDPKTLVETCRVSERQCGYQVG